MLCLENTKYTELETVCLPLLFATSLFFQSVFFVKLKLPTPGWSMSQCYSSGCGLQIEWWYKPGVSTDNGPTYLKTTFSFNTQLIHRNCSFLNNNFSRWLFHSLFHVSPFVRFHKVDALKAFAGNFLPAEESALLAAYVWINSWKLFAKSFPDEKWAELYAKQYSPREALLPSNHPNEGAEEQQSCQGNRGLVHIHTSQTPHQALARSLSLSLCEPAT